MSGDNPPIDPFDLRRSTPGAVTRVPVVVRTVADVETLRANARALRNLPRSGVRVRVAGVDACQARRFERQIEGYIRACGCAEGGAAAIAGLLATLAWLTWKLRTSGPHWPDLVAAAVGVCLVIPLAGLGKLLGLIIAKIRFERSCTDLMHGIDHGSSVGTPTNFGRR